MVGGAGEPAIRPHEAEEMCAEPYPCRSAAVAAANRLRDAGWLVVEHPEHPRRRPDGAQMVASVYHPVSFESPGDLLVICAPDRDRPTGPPDSRPPAPCSP